jgi:hypothetical protein
MNLVITPDQDAIFLALWNFLTSILPAGNAVFTGSIAGSVLTVTDVTEGTIAVNDVVLGDRVKAQTIVIPGGTGSGGVGTYNLSQTSSVPVASQILSTGVEIIQSQVDFVPEPKVQDFVKMTPMRFPRLATNLEAFTQLSAANNQKTVTQEAECVIQLDVHGPNSANFAQIISTLTRSEDAVDFFNLQNSAITPLYADDPRQMPFNNSEQGYENRYVIEFHLQVNQTITAAQQFADQAAVELWSVEHPPEP